MRQFILIVILLYAAIITQAQNVVNEARRIIDTLASATMQGRGYVNNGDVKAAVYIYNYLTCESKIPSADVKLQKVNFDINTFPGAMELRVDDKLITPGKDYIVKAFSKGIKGKYDVKYVNFKKLWKEDSLNLNIKCKKYEVLCFKHDKWPKSLEKKKTEWLLQNKLFGAAAVLELNDKKLTMDASQEVLPYTWIQMLVDTNYKAPKTVRLNIENKFVSNYESQNVFAVIKGTEVPDTFLVFTAHYDHLGALGNNTYFPGANDNASGVSMLLNLSREISRQPLKYSTAFIFFTGEEAGLIGSRYFTEHPLIPLSQIKFLVNTDLAGTGDDGIKVVNGAVDTLHFNKLKDINNKEQLMKSVQARGKAANSDHYFFTQAGVPSFFIYTLGGISAYHDVYDKAETLPLTDYEDYYRLLLLFMKSF
jgi:hypothetical protein